MFICSSIIESDCNRVIVGGDFNANFTSVNVNSLVDFLTNESLEFCKNHDKIEYTVKPVYNNPSGDKAKVNVIHRESLYKGFESQTVGGHETGLDNVEIWLMQNRMIKVLLT